MRRAISILSTAGFLATIGLGCASKPPPKVCSSEAPPTHEKGPIPIGVCTNDGPPSISDAGTSDAGDDATPPFSPSDAGTSTSDKSALAH